MFAQKLENMCFMDFIVWFLAFVRATPQHLLVKDGKNPRLIWNEENMLFHYEYTMKEVTDKAFETECSLSMFFSIYACGCTIGELHIQICRLS